MNEARITRFGARTSCAIVFTWRPLRANSRHWHVAEKRSFHSEEQAIDLIADDEARWIGSSAHGAMTVHAFQ